MICAIYARKSTDDSYKDREAQSTTRQIENATAYAVTKGWIVDEAFIFMDNDVSGAEWKHRPGFNALLAALAPRPSFGVLIVENLSRIGRDTVRTPLAVLQLEEAGVEIHTYTGERISMADESNEIATVVQSLVTSFQRNSAQKLSHAAA